MQLDYWTASGCFVAIAALSAYGDHRRNRRTDLDRVGWMPWPLLLILSILAAALCAALAIKS